MNTSTLCISGLIALIPVGLIIRAWIKAHKEVVIEDREHQALGIITGHRAQEKK